MSLIFPGQNFDIEGHRGARGLFPENTLTAFQEALKIGVNTLEMDVVISKDHQVVVSHEPWMSEEICSAPDGKPIQGPKEKNNLYNLTYSEIRNFDCGIRGNARFPFQKAIPEYKPLLKEVIVMAETFTKQEGLKSVNYNIETKSAPATDDIFHPLPQVFTQLLYDELKNLDVLERCIIQSFDVRTLQALKKIDASVKTSLLVENTLSIERNLHELGFLPDIYSPDFTLLNSSSVKILHEKGIAVIPWTVNEEEDMRELFAMGVEGFITDYPDRAVKLIKRI